MLLLTFEDPIVEVTQCFSPLKNVICASDATF